MTLHTLKNLNKIPHLHNLKKQRKSLETKDETDNENPQSKGAHQSSQNTQLRSTENNDDPKDSTQLKSSNKEQDTREQNNEKK